MFCCLTDFKRVSHSPFFSVALMAWITLPPEWGNSWGSLVLTSSSLPTFLECLGKLEGQLLRLGLEHSLVGLLHRTRAIGGACCFLHKALFPHPIPSCTALESSYSWGCLLTCSLRKQQHFVENCVGQDWKKITFFRCSKHRDKETLPALQCWIFKRGSCGGRDFCGEKKLEIGSWDELTTTVEWITQDSSWAINQ